MYSASLPSCQLFYQFVPSVCTKLSLVRTRTVSWKESASQQCCVWTPASFAFSLEERVSMFLFCVRIGVYWCVPVLVSVNSTQARVLWDEETSTEEMPVPDWPIGVWGQMIDVGGPSPLWAVSLWAGGSGLYKKAAGCPNHRRKPVNRFLSRSLSAWSSQRAWGGLGFPYDGCDPDVWAKGTLAFLSCFRSWCLYSNRKQNRTAPLWWFLLLLLFVT